MLKVDASDLALTREALYRTLSLERAASGHAAAAPPSSVMKSRLFINRLVRPQSLWQATKHEHNASPVGSAQANAPEVFSVEPEDFPAAKHMCESSVDREPGMPNLLAA